MQRLIAPSVMLLVACTGDNYYPPLALHDLTLTTAEDTPVTIDVELSAADASAVVLSVTTLPSHGTLSGVGPLWTYTPAHDYVGRDLLEVRGSDPTGSATTTVTLIVTPINDRPVARPDSLADGFNTPLTIAPATLLANDTDVDNATLSVTAVDSAVNGTVMLAGDNIVFMPDIGFAGAASFDYTISDGALTAQATVTVTVGVDAAPVAVDDTALTNEDTTLVIADATLLANDSDADLQTLTIVTLDNAIHGSVTHGGGQITFVPDPDFHGAASFDYTVTDGFKFDVGGVVVTVASVNDAPIAVADTATTDEDLPLTLSSATLTANDTDVDGDLLTVSAASATASSHGTVTLDSGVVTYTPDADFNGTAELSYTVSDGNGGAASALVTITVNPVNDAPTAVADAFTSPEDTVLVLVVAQLTANDGDVDGDDILVTDVGTTATTHGSVALVAGSITYAPDADYNGPADFSYTISDGHGGTATASVQVTVLPGDDAPVAVDDTATVTEGSSDNAIDVRANDTDIDGGARTVAQVTPPGHGSAAIVPDGLGILYTPASGYCNQAPNAPPDTFTYTLAPGASSATVSVSVLCACGKNKPTDFIVGSN